MLLEITDNLITYVGIRFGRPGDRGAGFVEYGLLVALIAAVIVVVVQNVGQDASTLYSSSGDAITTNN